MSVNWSLLGCCTDLLLKGLRQSVGGEMMEESQWDRDLTEMGGKMKQDMETTARAKFEKMTNI